ncbi:Dabb family protein [Granulosicoccus sp. 3-233]|uniref:Dabb family protein n=1 Tax=Granulosicoccus sp. 3-233 TaxID=3417969 RepID=UPI003D34FD0B
MIRHCVFIRFNEEASVEHRQALFSQLAALQSRLNGISAFHAGINVSPETGMDHGFADGFMIDFDTAEDRDAYLADEEHQAIGAQLVQSAEGGTAGILVFDMDIADGV